MISESGSNMENGVFNKVNDQIWREAATSSLGGKNVDKLSKLTYDNIEIEPLYHASIKRDQAKLPNGAWQINQPINHPDINIANQQIQQDLEQGVNALSLFSNQSLNAHQFGVNINSVNIKKIFKNIYLNMINLRIESGLDEFEIAKLVENHYIEQDYFSKSTQLSLGIDPIGKLAQYGGWQNDVSTIKSKTQAALKGFQANHILRIDGRIAHQAGASEAQELSFILGAALTYLKWADEAKIDLNIAAKKIEICLSTTQNQFMSIAKIRAVRQLWAELLEGLGIELHDAFIFAESSFRMVSKRDPWVNILRSTVACLSAGLGGANQIALLPISAALGLAPSFDRRIARHIQTILIEESHLADICDPSKGSAYVETLTDSLVKKSWQVFQTCEKSGGLLENLINGNIQSDIAKTTTKRLAQLTTRQQAITGTSEFPNLTEDDYKCTKAPEVGILHAEFAIKVTALKPIRDAEIFESLRDKSDRILKIKGTRPSILIAKIGSAKDYLGRSTFAQNFFEVGGITALDAEGGVDMVAIINDFKASGSNYAIIASSDAHYQKHAVELAQLLKQNGAKHLYLAGNPPADAKTAYQKAGIDEFVHVKTDLVQSLNALYTHIEKGDQNV